MRPWLASLLLLSACAGTPAATRAPAALGPAPDLAPIACDACAGWNAPRAPFKIFGNTYFVGTEGLGAVLVADPAGLVLLDGALPQSVPQIVANVQALGFDVRDVKWILPSHAHYDHVGGIAALARLSGARVAATPHAARTLRVGTALPDDPQVGYGAAMRFPPVPPEVEIVELHDGATVTLGKLTLAIHYTPGHTPGGQSWSWKSCEGPTCLDVVYADSLMPVSAPGFRFDDQGGARVAQFRSTIVRVAALPCDVLISAHPAFSGLFERQARGVVVDKEACRAYAAAATRRLDQRLRDERAGR